MKFDVFCRSFAWELMLYMYIIYGCWPWIAKKEKVFYQWFTSLYKNTSKMVNERGKSSKKCLRRSYECIYYSFFLSIMDWTCITITICRFRTVYSTYLYIYPTIEKWNWCYLGITFNANKRVSVNHFAAVAGEKRSVFKSKAHIYKKSCNEICRNGVLFAKFIKK